MEVALAYVGPRDNIVVSGDVPYELGGPTLEELMEEHLIDNGFRRESIITRPGGVDTFSQAQIFCSSLPKNEEIVVVSSNWFLLRAKPVYRRHAKKNGRSVKFISISRTGGLITWTTYIVLSAIDRMAMLVGKFDALEEHMISSNQSRRQGFKWDGCR